VFVLGRVGQTLGDDVVDGYFQPFVETQCPNAGNLDRERGAVRE
jgi:hypothetical protein